MIRVLHLAESRLDYPTSQTLAHLLQLGPDFSVATRLIGPRGDVANVPIAAIDLRWFTESAPDLVHAWGPRALRAAVWAGCRKIIYSPTTPAVKLCGSSVLRISRIVTCSQSLRSRWIAKGAPADRCVAVDPFVDLHRIPSKQNGALRKSLGFSESDIVALAPGESSRENAHRLAMWAVAILNVLDARYRLLIWGQGPEVEFVERFAKKLHQPQVLVNASRKLGQSVAFETLAAAADFAMVTSRGPIPTLPMAVCMAAGLPLVCGATATAREFLQDNQSGFLSDPYTPKLLAQRALELQQDRAAAARIAAAAKSAARRFDAETVLAAWREIYQRAVSDC